MKQKNKLSVVTVTYKPNVKELILFIDSFYKFNDLGEDAHLIIVDNSPIDSWDDTTIREKYKQLTFISNPSNPGFGASNNIGFDEFESEYVLFINNDVELIEPVFKDIINEFDKDNRLGCVGIHQYGGSPSFFIKMTSPKNISNQTFIDKYHFVSGAFLFFKSDIFKKIGKFDPGLFMYFEEFDLSNRLIDNGYHTTYLEHLNFLHKVGNRRIANEESWKRGIPSFCHICRKYNLDPIKYSKPIIRRIIFLQIYNLLKLNFKEVLKLQRIKTYRMKYVKNDFGIK